MNMRKACYILVLSLVIFFVGCKDKQSKPAILVDDPGASEADSTIYGVCGEGTAMHTLELITDNGDTLSFSIYDCGEDSTALEGGLLCGDRMAVVASKKDGEYVAHGIINLTTLMGRWTSIDKNFEISEGGNVRSFVNAEKNSWTSWKILNGNLLLNKDTFTVNMLSADSLCLENDKGIFVFNRETDDAELTKE